MASGGQHGLAQSVFQVGGNVGSAVGPLLAAFIVLPHGQSSVAWFSVAALLGMFVLFNVGHWYKAHGLRAAQAPARRPERARRCAQRKVALAIAVLLALIFSKYFYLASLSSYYTFYLISRFHVSVQSAQLLPVPVPGRGRARHDIGGPLGDRVGRKYIIWASILGVLPFTLLCRTRTCSGRAC